MLHPVSPTHETTAEDACRFGTESVVMQRQGSRVRTMVGMKRLQRQTRRRLGHNGSRGNGKRNGASWTLMSHLLRMLLFLKPCQMSNLLRLQRLRFTTSLTYPIGDGVVGVLRPDGRTHHTSACLPFPRTCHSYALSIAF